MGLIRLFRKKTVNHKQNNSSVGWFNAELKAMREHLNLLKDIASKTNSVAVRNQCRQYQNQYRQKIRESKINYNNKTLTKSHFSVKSVWQVINGLRAGKKSNIKADFNPNEVNEYFINVPNQVVSQLNNINYNFKDLLEKIDSTHEIEFTVEPVSFIEIRDIINNIKSKSTRYIFGLSVDINQN